ncbi:hypothetical protein ACRAWG_09735 [Methylobacterium sp. P31]
MPNWTVPTPNGAIGDNVRTYGESIPPGATVDGIIDRRADNERPALACATRGSARID